MRMWRALVPLYLICSMAFGSESRLPFNAVFKGQEQFNRLVAKAKTGNWKGLPIGERTATVGQALVGTRYKHFTLEIDNRIESPSVNFQGMDCWTFFEIALSFARMLNEPESNWTPERLLHYIELDRYRGGQCSGDIIGIISRDRNGLYSTAHVGLAFRTNDGVLHFMHASSPGNYGHVIVDAQPSKYLYRYRSDSGILVARPLR